MNQPFSPGGSGAHVGYPENFVAPAPAPLTREEIERQQWERNNRVETFRAPGECTFKIDGQTFISRRHHIFGHVIDLPTRRINELIHAREIDLGQGATMSLRFEVVHERIG
jgi:hypothetical protein